MSEKKEMTREETIKILNDEEIASLVGKFHGGKDALDLALSALRPVSREQVEKVWRGEWFDYRETSVGVPKRLCSRCGNVFKGFNTKFCEECGAPMTDEAVDILLKRLEALKDETD